MRFFVITCFVSQVVAAASAIAAPALYLVSNSTGSNVGTIAAGTSTYTLDLQANTDGMPISGLQFYVTSSPAAVVTYGNVPVTPLNAPFTMADLSGPSAGATVQKNNGHVALFKSSAGDYAAFTTHSIASLSLNISSLGTGAYVFTPIPEEFVNSSVDLPGSAFAPSGQFTLTVNPIPEPASLGLMGLAAFFLTRRARTRASNRTIMQSMPRTVSW